MMKEKTGSQTRLEFLQSSTVNSATIAAPTILPASILGVDDKLARSERITNGMIGIGSQARAYNLLWFLKSPETWAMPACDVDSWQLENERDMVIKYFGLVSKAVATC